jgi:ubiquinone/menaquinone biosynthesis C-methylase UbiE
MDSDDRQLIQEQIEYYRRRAPEYDRSSKPPGDPLDAHGAILEQALQRFAPSGSLLELACGTGNWTSRLRDNDCAITALDSSPEMIELHRRKLQDPTIHYITADLFQWVPETQFDVVMFTFWLSHVPLWRFTQFWDLVARCLVPGGRVWFAEETPLGDWRGQEFIDEDRRIVRRRLNDGEEHRAVKVFWDPQELQDRLRFLGWDIIVTSTGAFYWGEGRRAQGR